MEQVTASETVVSLGEMQPYRLSDRLPVPHYLEQTYWWAYLHPNGVRFFERPWIVNMILWGNYARLRDAALDELGATISGRTLQVACVYGNFSPKLAARLAPSARLDVVDVAPVQLENVCRKIKRFNNVHLHHQDSTALTFEEGSFDNVVLFFLLHEQPEEVRAKTVREAIRMTKPGGRVLFVDYHLPVKSSPFRYFMRPLLSLLEPFALDMWRNEIERWVPEGVTLKSIHKETYFGGLYQKVVFTR